MIEWKTHRVWMGMLLLAALISAAGTPLLGLAQQQASKKLSALHTATDKDTQALRQLQADIDATEKLKTQIKTDEVDKALPPVDRLRVAQILEHRAAESRLTHFTYTLSPEEKTVIDTVGAGKQVLATSKITLAADAPTDIDAYQFLDSLRHALPGRLTLHDISSQRIGMADAPITDANVHLAASGDWLSNGASVNLSEERK